MLGRCFVFAAVLVALVWCKSAKDPVIAANEEEIAKHIAFLVQEVTTKSFDCAEFERMSSSERVDFLTRGEFDGAINPLGMFNGKEYRRSTVEQCADTIKKLTPRIASCMLRMSMTDIKTEAATCPVMQIEGGPVGCRIRDILLISRGTQAAQVKQWLGIPYASPPVGNKRWAAPERLAPEDYWTTPKGYEMGKACAQRCRLPWSACPCHGRIPPLDFLCFQPGMLGDCYRSTFFGRIPGGGSDDCLNLNVWAPVESDSTSKLPVLLIIHGGSFIVGTANAPAAFGDKMAALGNMVVVTINYRLNVMGFLASKKHGLEGNYGFLDMVAALEWVQRNIHHFGGDPTRVTVQGQSAGGGAVLMLMTSPIVPKGLFARAISQSPSIAIPFHEKDLPPVTIEQFFDGVDCKSENPAEALRCARSASSEQVIHGYVSANADVMSNGLQSILDMLEKSEPFLASYTFNFGPVVDGRVFTDQVLVDMLHDRIVHRVPLVIGYTDDEGAVFNHNYWLPYHKLPGMEEKQVLDRAFTLFGASGLPFHMVTSLQFGSFAPNVQTHYDVDWLGLDNTNNLNALEAIFTDVYFKCPILHAAKVVTGLPIFLYKFTASFPMDIPWQEMCAQRACHAADLGFSTGACFERRAISQVLDLSVSIATERKKRRESERRRFGLKMDNYEGKEYDYATDLSPDDLDQLGEQFIYYWASFIASGDPNGGPQVQQRIVDGVFGPNSKRQLQSTPKWEQFSGPQATGNAMHLDFRKVGQTKDHGSAEVCEVMREQSGYFF